MKGKKAQMQNPLPLKHFNAGTLLIVKFYLQPMYIQQQNKWYSQRCLLAHFEVNSILVIANLLAHNNLGLCYWVSKFAMTKIECSFEMGK